MFRLLLVPYEIEIEIEVEVEVEVEVEESETRARANTLTIPWSFTMHTAAYPVIALSYYYFKHFRGHIARCLVGQTISSKVKMAWIHYIHPLE